MTHPILVPLAEEITRTRGVVQSATGVINGIAARIETAHQEALANGASEAELQPFVALESALEADVNVLAQAVAANP